MPRRFRIVFEKLGELKLGVTHSLRILLLRLCLVLESHCLPEFYYDEVIKERKDLYVMLKTVSDLSAQKPLIWGIQILCVFVC